MTYHYDRTAGDETEAAFKWLKAERKKVIQKHMKAMSKELEKVMDEGKTKFPNYDSAEISHRLRQEEAKYRE